MYLLISSIQAVMVAVVQVPLVSRPPLHLGYDSVRINNPGYGESDEYHCLPHWQAPRQRWLAIWSTGIQPLGRSSCKPASPLRLYKTLLAIAISTLSFKKAPHPHIYIPSWPAEFPTNCLT